MTNEMPVSAFAVKPTLTGERVTLRPFLAQDTPVLRSMLRDAEIGRLTGSVHAGGEADAWDETAEARMLAWYASRNEQSDRLDLAVVDRSTGGCVGEVVLNLWDEPNRSCNLRIALVPGGQNRGLGTEAVRLMVAHGFEQLGLHRISLNVYDFNPRARRAYEKVGFVQEGARRDVLYLDGGWASDVLMSILAPEWERHRSVK